MLLNFLALAVYSFFKILGYSWDVEFICDLTMLYFKDIKRWIHLGNTSNMQNSCPTITGFYFIIPDNTLSSKCKGLYIDKLITPQSKNSFTRAY